MKKKITILFITVVLTIIIFSISTYMQKQMVNYEPVVSCLIAIQDINENTVIGEDMIRAVEMPVSIVSNVRLCTNIDDIVGLYARSDIYSGQVIVDKQLGAKEELHIFEIEDNKEKISVKLKNTDNANSYQIKEGSIINLYATLDYELAEGFSKLKDRMTIGTIEDGYAVIKMLENVELIGAFSSEGQVIDENNTDCSIDTVMLAVSKEDAMEINLIRDICSFNITSIK